MMQRLTLPMDDCYVTAAYLSPEYLAYYNRNHWGYDFGNKNKTAPILASAQGEVVVAGYDDTCGNIIIVKYSNAIYNDGDITVYNGKPFDILARYLHLSEIMCKVGDKVERGQVIGRMGNTGKVTSGPHLHFELDTDTRPEFYTWTPTVKGSNILKSGKSGTLVSPAELLTIGPGQKLALSSNAWADREDIALPIYTAVPSAPSTPDFQLEYTKLAANYNALLQSVSNFNADLLKNFKEV